MKFVKCNFIHVGKGRLKPNSNSTKLSPTHTGAFKVDVETLQKVRKNTNIEIQASGGFSSIEDIKKVRNIGVEYIILGRAIHSKIISIEDAIAVEDL